MSEIQKKRRCLHCSVFDPKYRYQEIFDEFGLELGLPALLSKHFHFDVRPDPKQQQLLCEICVGTLIRLFDIDELERQRDAGKAAKGPRLRAQVQGAAPKAAPKVPAKAAKPPPRELSARLRKSNSLKQAPADRQLTKKAPNESDQDQISRLIRNILNDDEAIIEEVTESEESQRQATNRDQEPLIDERTEALEPVLENIKIRPELRQKLHAEESQSEGEIDEGDNSTVVVFDLVEIKEKDDIGDVLEYLATVVKTSFEKLAFEWATVCRHCSLKCANFETLLAHQLKAHKSRNNVYKCPMNGCSKELKGHQFLAMHLVVMHGPVMDLTIYGSCPECKMTFSNILQYNKHSCAHFIKKKRGARLFCDMCAQEFRSWKRFNFHNQFHLEKHRPRNCFICDYASSNIDELFQHLNYFHEPADKLFCDLCDLTFRDAAVLAEHNKSHASVSSTTFTCVDCMANFESRGRLNGHMRTVHGSVISCELCSREFASETTYNMHMKKHLIIERDVYVCNKCGELSDSHENMLAHAASKESKCLGAKINTELIQDAYICEYCSSYFKQKSDLQAHRKSGAHKDGVYWCKPCKKGFSLMKLYSHHIRTSQQLRADTTHRRLEICVFYMCDYEGCSEAYVNWNSLYTHRRRTHESSSAQSNKLSKSEQEWICQFCSKKCRSKMSLSVHVARSHNNDNVVCSLCNASYKSQEALKKHHAYWHEPIECPQCFKIVKNRRNYDTHVNVVHSNSKRYSCSVCEKGFYHKSEMEAHQRLHGQSFSCSECRFTTKNKESLSVHILGQHKKQFAFQCKKCNKRFGRRQGLNTHMLRAHGAKLLCRDHFEGGCGRTFGNSAQLHRHVRKVHKGTILLADDVLEEEEEYSMDDGPSTSSKRCIRLDDGTNIEFLDDQEAMELVDEVGDSEEDYIVEELDAVDAGRP
ncbi:hypothetical protein KR018_007115 [Drosophila ironensis]|nr:hypothetical protein KR018_007115 [Drosophila ironensis]